MGLSGETQAPDVRQRMKERRKAALSCLLPAPPPPPRCLACEPDWPQEWQTTSQTSRNVACREARRTRSGPNLKKAPRRPKRRKFAMWSCAEVEEDDREEEPESEI